MSFIQCKNESEVEAIMKTRKHGFVTEDHRIYDSITLSDDALYYEFDSELAMALMDLKLNVEMIGEDGFEQSFNDLVANAKLVSDNYSKVREILKRKAGC